MNSRIGVAALALVSFLNTGFPEEPRRVGESCDPSQVVYRGLETYSAKKITAELNRHPDYLLASHPFAPLPGLLSFIERNVRAGLRHTGFPDAKVAARLAPGSRQIEITVSEGPRYLCGGVVISGLRELSDSFQDARPQVLGLIDLVRRVVILFQTRCIFPYLLKGDCLSPLGALPISAHVPHGCP